MAHVYGHIAGLHRFMKDGGDDPTTGLGTTNDTTQLLFLEDASRKIDGFCQRSGADHVMSGFGPRIGTNRYDGWYGSRLWLDDDLLSITSVSVTSSFGGSTATYTDETDFVKRPFDRTPYRSLQLTHSGALVWYTQLRGVSIVGTWGHQNTTEANTTTVSSGLASGTTAASFTTSATPTISPGMTLLIGTEQCYLSGLSSTTATIERGSNGTTAATHANSSALTVYRYDRRVEATTYRLALHLWKQRDAGLSGGFGGGDLPQTGNPDPSEYAILKRGVGDLRIYGVA